MRFHIVEATIEATELSMAKKKRKKKKSQLERDHLTRRGNSGLDASNAYDDISGMTPGE